MDISAQSGCAVPRQADQVSGAGCEESGAPGLSSLFLSDADLGVPGELLGGMLLTARAFSFGALLGCS